MRVCFETHLGDDVLLKALCVGSYAGWSVRELAEAVVATEFTEGLIRRVQWEADNARQRGMDLEDVFGSMAGEIVKRLR